jgi:hypothetical protein
MARTTAALLDRLLKRLPPCFEPVRPLLAAAAAQLHLVEAAGDDLAAAATVDGADDIWLSLLARGYGVERAVDEDDASLRRRLRNVEGQVTPEAVMVAVEAMVDAISANTSELIEHWAAPHQALDVSAVCDVSHLYDRIPGFTVRVPVLNGDQNHPAYAGIYAEILRVKAAGVPAWMVVENP